MNDNEFKDWVGQLPQLSKVQLDNLSTRTKLLTKITQKQHDGKQDVGGRVLEALVYVMKKNKVEAPSTLSLKRSAAYAASTGKLNELAAYLESISQLKLIQDQLLKIALGLLFEEMLNWQGVSISSHTILRQIHRIPSVLNRGFPGYAASGLLAKVVKGQ